jgi:hypothetical protein
MKKIAILILVLTGACLTTGPAILAPGPQKPETNPPQAQETPTNPKNSNPETPQPETTNPKPPTQPTNLPSAPIAETPRPETPSPQAPEPYTTSTGFAMAAPIVKGTQAEQEALYLIRMNLEGEDDSRAQQLIQEAVQKGYNLNGLDQFGYAPIVETVKWNHPGALQLMIDNGARLDLAFSRGPLRQLATQAKPFEFTQENFLDYWYSEVKAERGESGLESEWLEEAQRRLQDPELMATTRAYFQDIHERFNQVQEILDRYRAPGPKDAAWITQRPVPDPIVYQHQLTPFTGTYDPLVCLVQRGGRTVFYDDHTVDSITVTRHRSRNASDPAQYIIRDHQGIEALKETMWKPWWYDQYSAKATMSYQGRQWELDHVEFYDNGSLKSGYFIEDKPAWLMINEQRYDPRRRTKIEFYESGQVKTFTLGGRFTKVNGWSVAGDSNHRIFFHPDGHASKIFYWIPSRTAHEMNVLCFPPPEARNGL